MVCIREADDRQPQREGKCVPEMMARLDHMAISIKAYISVPS